MIITCGNYKAEISKIGNMFRATITLNGVYFMALETDNLKETYSQAKKELRTFNHKDGMVCAYK